MLTLVWNGKEHSVKVDKSSLTDVLFKEAAEFTKIKENRIRLYYTSDEKRLPLQRQERVSKLKSNSFEIVDSGPQFSFMIGDLFEYIPPLFIWAAVVLYSKVPIEFEYVQITSVMWIMHYCKRSFEAVFIHTYSQRTLPIFSLIDNSTFKNCLYYWCFSFLMAWNVVYRASYKPQFIPVLQNIGVIVWLMSELFNGYCHIMLRKLRPPGSLGHFLPKGFLFNQITCPNYTFEILSWVGFAMYAQTFVSILFPICGGGQMFIWADEKRNKLASQWPEVRNRGRITPFRFL